MKKFILSMFCVCMTSVLIGLAAKASYKDTGIFKITNTDELNKQKYGLVYLKSEKDFGNAEEIAQSMWNSKTSVNESAVILVVRPTGNIKIMTGSFRQEVEILKVIRGSGTYLNKIGYINLDQGFITKEKANKQVGYTLSNYDIMYMGTICNVMKKDNIYLAFLMENSLNSHLEKPVFNTNKDIGDMAYFNLSNDESFYVKKGIDELTLQDFSGSEFLCRTESALNAAQELKKQVIEKGKDQISEYLVK